MKLVAIGMLGIGLIVVLAVLYALPVMLLWNWLMPLLFGLPKVTFLQALGLSLLSNFLFKSSNTCSK